MPPAFRLEALPDAARDAIFEAVTRFDAARACCVSTAWNAALCRDAPHLWAELDFTSYAQFEAAADEPRKALRLRVTDKVVRGACGKERQALRAIKLYEGELADLLPELMTAYPSLRCVEFRQPAGPHDHSSHALKARLEKLSLLDVRTAVYASDEVGNEGYALLQRQPPLRVTRQAVARPTLRLTELYANFHYGLSLPRIQRVALPSYVELVARALRDHAHTLRDATLYFWDAEGGPAFFEPLCGALSACHGLHSLRLDHFLRTHTRPLPIALDSLAALAVALQRGSLRRLSLMSTCFLHPAFTQLPSLTHLILDLFPDHERDATRTAADAAAFTAALAAALRDQKLPLLRTLKLRGDVAVASAVLNALPSTQLHKLTLALSSEEDEPAPLALLSRVLPASLTQLSVATWCTNDAFDASVPAFLQAVCGTPRLASLKLDGGDRGFSGATLLACANALLRAGAAPQLRRLALIGREAMPAECVELARVLHGNTTLEELRLGLVPADALTAFGDALANNTHLLRLTLSHHMDGGINYDDDDDDDVSVNVRDEEASAAALRSLGAGVRRNSTLRMFSLTMWNLWSVLQRAGEAGAADAAADEPVHRALEDLQAAANAHSACTLENEVMLGA
jgi:hypothetical protein